MRLIYALIAAGTALTNSTAETRLGHVPLPANFWQVGKVVRLRGSVRATATNSTDTFRPRVRVGPTTLTGTVIGDGTAVDVADNDVFVFDLQITCRSVGTAGELVVSGLVSIIGVEGTATARAAFERITSYDTTVAQLLEVTGVWSVASASDSAQLEDLTVIELV